MAEKLVGIVSHIRQINGWWHGKREGERQNLTTDYTDDTDREDRVIR